MDKTTMAWVVIAIGAIIEIYIATLDLPPRILHIGLDGFRWIKDGDV